MTNWLIISEYPQVLFANEGNVCEKNSNKI
jgi:hypothetical protein